MGDSETELRSAINTSFHVPWQLFLDPMFLLGCAFLVRLLGIGLTLTVGNPFAGGQADVFAWRAAIAAENIRQGQPVGFSMHGRTSSRLGPILAPFWLLPGPSLIYTSIVNAAISVAAIYNIYVVVSRLHSRLAGSLAIVPLAFYPSFILIHSTLQREAALLFAITATIRLLAVPPEYWSSTKVYGGALLALCFATFLRHSNAVIFVAVLAIAFAYYLIYRTKSLGVVAAITTLGTFVGIWLSRYTASVVAFVSELRGRRARGRTAYLVEFIPQTFPEVLVFSGVGAFYFLFTPLPWMISAAGDLMVGIEAMVTLALAVIGVSGVRALYKRAPVLTVALVSGLVLASVAYGLGTANVGTAVRHRQGIQWIIFVFGAVAITERVGYEYAPRQPKRRRRTYRRRKPSQRRREYDRNQAIRTDD